MLSLSRVQVYTEVCTMFFFKFLILLYKILDSYCRQVPTILLFSPQRSLSLFHFVITFFLIKIISSCHSHPSLFSFSLFFIYKTILFLSFSCLISYHHTNLHFLIPYISIYLLFLSNYKSLVLSLYIFYIFFFISFDDNIF